jgi:hypothetical protein
MVNRRMITVSVLKLLPLMRIKKAEPHYLFMLIMMPTLFHNMDV